MSTKSSNLNGETWSIINRIWDRKLHFTSLWPDAFCVTVLWPHTRAFAERWGDCNNPYCHLKTIYIYIYICFVPCCSRACRPLRPQIKCHHSLAWCFLRHGVLATYASLSGAVKRLQQPVLLISKQYLYVPSPLFPPLPSSSTRAPSEHTTSSRSWDVTTKAPRAKIDLITDTSRILKQHQDQQDDLLYPIFWTKIAVERILRRGVMKSLFGFCDCPQKVAQPIGIVTCVTDGCIEIEVEIWKNSIASTRSRRCSVLQSNHYSVRLAHWRLSSVDVSCGIVLVQESALLILWGAGRLTAVGPVLVCDNHHIARIVHATPYVLTNVERTQTLAYAGFASSKFLI